MKQRNFGRTGLKVSEIGFGGWSIGGEAYGHVDETEAVAALTAAYEMGVNFFDTADTYGEGRSENLIGRALGRWRDKIFVATKGGNDFYGEKVRKNFDPKYISNALEKSLKRLNTDYVDVYLLHNPSLEVMRQGDCFEVLRRLQAEGKLRFFGASLSTPEEVAFALDVPGLSAVEAVFNMLDTHSVWPVRDQLTERGAAFVARSPLLYGLLAGGFKPNTVFEHGDHRATRWTRPEFTHLVNAVERLRFLCDKDIQSMAEAALRYVLSFDWVSTVIPGIKSREQLKQNVRASQAAPAYLGPETIARIEEIAHAIAGQAEA